MQCFRFFLILETLILFFFLNKGNENDVDFNQKRWKQLRDSYVKAKKKENAYVPSGSSGVKNDKMTFALYNQMKFLDDVIEKSS